MTPSDNDSTLQVKVKIDTSEVLDDVINFDNNEIIQDLENRLERIESTVAQPLGTPYHMMNLERIIDVLQEQLGQLTFGDVNERTRRELIRDFMTELDTLLSPFAGYETEEGVPLTFGQIGYALEDEEKITAHARAEAALNKVFYRFGGMVSSGGTIYERGMQSIIEELQSATFKMADMHPILGAVFESLGREVGAKAEAPMGGGAVDLLTQMINEFKTGKFNISGAAQVARYGQTDVLQRIRAYRAGERMYEGKRLFPDAPYASLMDVLRPESGTPAIHPLRVLSMRKMTGPAAAELPYIAQTLGMNLMAAGLLGKIEDEEFVPMTYGQMEKQLPSFQAELIKVDQSLMQSLQADISERIRNYPAGELPSQSELYGWTLQHISHSRERAEAWGSFIGIDPEVLIRAGAAYGGLPYISKAMRKAQQFTAEREKEDIDDLTTEEIAKIKPPVKRLTKFTAWQSRIRRSIKLGEKKKLTKKEKKELERLEAGAELNELYEEVFHAVSEEPEIFNFLINQYIARGKGSKKDRMKRLRKAVRHETTLEHDIETYKIAEIMQEDIKIEKERKKREKERKARESVKEDVPSPTETPEEEEGEEFDIDKWELDTSSLIAANRISKFGFEAGWAMGFIDKYVNKLKEKGLSDSDIMTEINRMAYNEGYTKMVLVRNRDIAQGYDSMKSAAKLEELIAETDEGMARRVLGSEAYTRMTKKMGSPISAKESEIFTEEGKKKLKERKEFTAMAGLMSAEELGESGEGEALIPRTMIRVPSTRSYFEEAEPTRKMEIKSLESRIKEIQDHISKLGDENMSEQEILLGHVNYLKLMIDRLSENTIALGDAIRVAMAGFVGALGD